MAGMTPPSDTYPPPPSPPLPAYQDVPPTYAEATALTSPDTRSTSFLPASLLLSSRTICAVNPSSSRTNPIYDIHPLSDTILHLSRSTSTDEGSEEDMEVVYVVQRLEVDYYVLTARAEDGGPNGPEISLRASVGPKGIVYSARSITPEEGVVQGTEIQSQDGGGEGLLLLVSDGRPAGGRRWGYCAASERTVTVAVEKEAKPEEVNKLSLKPGEGVKKLEFSERSLDLGDGVRELVVACWIARTWKWGKVEEGEKRRESASWTRKIKDRIKGEHWEVDKDGKLIRVGRPSIAETFRRYSEEGGPFPIGSKRAFIFGM